MKYLLALLILLMLVTPALSLVHITYIWTPPTAGAPVEYYNCEVRWYGTDWSACSGTAVDPQLTVETFDGVQQIQIRVAGVDSLSRQAPWSEASNPYSDPFPPGVAGTPTIDRIVHMIED